MDDLSISAKQVSGSPVASSGRTRLRPIPLDRCWRHSVRSTGSDSTCVDVAVCENRVGVRDSKEPDGPRLWFSFAEWQVFLDGVRDGEFELPKAGHGASSRERSRAIE